MDGAPSDGALLGLTSERAAVRPSLTAAVGTAHPAEAAALFAGPGEVRARCRAVDWASSPLGPVERWPPTLRAMVRVALAAGVPTLVLWGAELVPIYNDACARVLGAEPPVALGRGVRELFPECWEEHAPIYERVLAGETVTLEDARFPLARAGALDARFAIAYSPIPDDAGAVAGVLVTALETARLVRDAHDVDALRASERRHAFLTRLGDALRPVADPVQVQGVATRTLGEHLGVNHAYYVHVDADDAHVTCEADYVRGMPSLVGRYALDAYGPTLAAEYRAGRPVVIRDTADDPLVPAPLRAAWATIGIRAQLAVPLVKDGRFTAALGVDQAVPRAWTAEEVTLVQETAERTWAAVERARAEARARDRLAELESVYRGSPVGMCVFDRDLRYVRINERLAEINGLPAEAHLGRTVRELLPDLADTAEATLRRILETGTALRDVEFRGTTPAQPGVERVWLAQWLPLHDAAGAIVGVHVVAEEVTEQRRLVAEREAALAAERAARGRADDERRAAEAANAAKGHFLASMSHELRTPLNAIQGYVQLMQLELHGPLTGAQRDALDRVGRAQTRLLGLINDLLNYAKLEAGRVEFDVRPTRVRDVIADVIPLIEPQLAAKGLRLAVVHDASAGEEGAVWADREKLGQVLLNLLTNAAKFTPPRQADGTPGIVTIRVAPARAARPDVVVLQVHDTGIGIPREKQEAIFDPFIQVSTGLTRTSEGTGLGLAISRDLARGMGGDLEVGSEEGRGSTFTVTLRRVAP